MIFVSYLRVSTARQGGSGLGLEAQREAVSSFALSRGAKIVAEFVEVESGSRRDRPELAGAIKQAKASGAVLLIAKLDRLARSVAVISSLMEAGVEFLAVDNPHATRLMLHLLAAFAEHERGEISARTKAALAAAKARGVVLGANGRRLACEAVQDAVQFRRLHRNALDEIRASGATTLRQIAAALNARDIPSREGGSWHPGNTARLLKRLESPTH
jgi:DNA invertase Pin-like site-specific DNA recombinase